MSPETADAVRGLLNVCGETNEVQPTQHRIEVKVKGSPLPRAGRQCCMRIIEARKASVLWARRDNHVRITWPPFAVKTAPVRKRDSCKKRGYYTCLHFLLCVLSDQLYICSCAVYTGLLFRWYESTAAIARVSKEYVVSHCTMERRQDGLPANRVRNRGQRGRNPPSYCNCPDFVEDRWTAYVMWVYVYWDRTSGESLSEWRLF